jgi:UDP-glucose 4-epimerase
MSRILVTGGAGFIGSHVVDELAGRGHAVLVWDNLRTGSRLNLTEATRTGDVRLVVGDVLDTVGLEKSWRDFAPESVIHLAALVSVPEACARPDECFKVNVEATHRVAMLAARLGTRRMVFASSAAVYGDNPRLPLNENERAEPLSLYGGTKAASEELLAAFGADSGLETVSLRFFNVFGSRQRPDSPYSGVISIFTDRLQHCLPVSVFGDGDQTRDFIAVRDVARAVETVARISEPLQGVFNVCTGRPTSLNELVAALGSVSGHVPIVNREPPRRGDIRHSLGDPSRLERAVGFKASVGLADGLRAVLEGGER